MGRTGPMYRNSKEVPAQDLKKWIHSSVRSAWENEWRRTRGPPIRMIKDTTLSWTDVENWKDQQILTRMRSGHTRVSHDFSNPTNFRKNCMTCGVRLSVQHIISVCPEYQAARLQNSISSSVREALSNDPVTEQLMLNFLKDADLYHNI